MTTSDIDALEALNGAALTEYIKSLHEISRADIRNEVKYCIREKGAGKKTAVWLDGIMDQWANISKNKELGLPMSSRIDAYYVKNDKCFLLEFKMDGDLERYRDKLWLKFHDSYVQLIEHGWLDIKGAINNLYYFVITSTTLHYCLEKDIDEKFYKSKTNGEKSSYLIKLTNPMEDWMQRPWKHPEIKARCGLDCFEGTSCKKVMTITASQFERFVREEQWG